MITYDDIRNNAAVNSYIRAADSVLEALRYTEHGFAHVGAVAKTAGYILESLGYPEREAELARIAAYLHDIGNVVNRVDHAESGAVMICPYGFIQGDPRVEGRVSCYPLRCHGFERHFYFCYPRRLRLTAAMRDLYELARGCCRGHTMEAPHGNE